LDVFAGMFSWLQKYLGTINLALIALLGATLGLLAATAAGVWLTPSHPLPDGASATEASPIRKPALSDFGIILERNIFNFDGRIAASVLGPANPTAAAVISSGGLTLLGTVTAGSDSLALLRQGAENALYRLEDKLPGDAVISEISRNRVVITDPDGSKRELVTDPHMNAPATASTHSTGGGNTIRAIGKNRWQVSRDEVERARADLNSLLKSARMEPKIVDGRTQGFMVRMIRPRSLLDRLGLRRGDLVREVNGVSLDSPEKALQIFQQLREANHISVGLMRRNQPLNLEYHIE
jgi:general secretion pathway protein C